MSGFEKANLNLYCQSLTELIIFSFAKNNVNYAQSTPVLCPHMAQAS